MLKKIFADKKIFLMLSNIVKGSIASYSNKVVSMAGNLILVPMYLLYFGKEQYGLWLVILSIVSYFGFSNIGITQSVSNHVAGYNARNQYKNIISIVSTGFWLFIVIISAILIFILGIILLAPLESILKVSDELQDIVIPVLVISSVFFLLKLPLSVFNAALRSLNLIYKEQIFMLIFTVVQFIGVIIVLVSGVGIIGLSFTYGFTGLLSGILLYFYLKKIIPDFYISIKFIDKASIKKLMKPGGYFFVLNLGALLIFATDNIIISSSLGVESVTAYAIAFKVFLIILSIASVVTQNIIPSISAAYSLNNNQYLYDVYIKTLRLCLGYALLVSFLLFVGGRELMIGWVGSDNYVGDSASILIVFFMFISILLGPADVILVGTSQHKVYAIMAVIEGVINLILSIWWVYIWGVVGIIAATIIARIITNAWYLPYKASIITGAGIHSIVVKVINPFIAPFISTMIVIYILSFYDFFGWEKILIHSLFVLCVFTSTCYFFVLSENEKYKVKNIISILKPK